MRVAQIGAGFGRIAAVLAAAGLLAGQAALAGSFENARRLVAAMGVEAQLEETIVDAVDEATASLLQRGLPDATIRAASRAMKSEMLESVPQLLDEVITIYAGQFSDEELTELIEFYESPTGQKYARAQGTIKRKRERALEQWMEGVRTRTKRQLDNNAGV